MYVGYMSCLNHVIYINIVMSRLKSLDFCFSEIWNLIYKNEKPKI